MRFLLPFVLAATASYAAPVPTKVVHSGNIHTGDANGGDAKSGDSYGLLNAFGGGFNFGGDGGSTGENVGAFIARGEHYKWKKPSGTVVDSGNIHTGNANGGDAKSGDSFGLLNLAGGGFNLGGDGGSTGENVGAFIARGEHYKWNKPSGDVKWSGNIHTGDANGGDAISGDSYGLANLVGAVDVAGNAGETGGNTGGIVARWNKEDKHHGHKKEEKKHEPKKEEKHEPKKEHKKEPKKEEHKWKPSGTVVNSGNIYTGDANGGDAKSGDSYGLLNVAGGGVNVGGDGGSTGNNVGSVILTREVSKSGNIKTGSANGGDARGGNSSGLINILGGGLNVGGDGGETGSNAGSFIAGGKKGSVKQSGNIKTGNANGGNAIGGDSAGLINILGGGINLAGNGGDTGSNLGGVIV